MPAEALGDGSGGEVGCPSDGHDWHSVAVDQLSGSLCPAADVGDAAQLGALGFGEVDAPFGGLLHAACDQLGRPPGWGSGCALCRVRVSRVG